MSDYWVKGKIRKLDVWHPGEGPVGPAMPVLDGVLPDRVDLRDLCPPVMDQGSIGSCVANALCEAMEYLERNSRDDKLFSRLYLYYWARVLNGILPTDDAGLVISFAVDVLNSRGVPYESTWPYDDAANRFRLQPTPEADAEAAQHKCLLSFSCPNLFTMKSSLAQGFPLVFGMDLPESFMDAEIERTGVLTSLGEEGFAGGHSMLAVGYDDNMRCGPHQGALLARNSWSAGWGQEGHVWIPYEIVRRGLASDFTSIRRGEV